MKIVPSLAVSAALLLSQAPLTHADVAVGAGFTWNFKKDFLVGVRVFSDDERGEVVGTLGYDFNLTNNSFRPAIGAAYLGGDGYTEINAGYDFLNKGFDFGVGVGLVNSEEEEENSSNDDAPPPEDTDLVTRF